MKSKKRKLLRDNDFITWFLPSVKRMALALQISRSGDAAFEPLGSFVQTKLSKIIERAAKEAVAGKRKTVFRSDAEIALEAFPLSDSFPTKRCSKRVSEDCYYLPKLPFERLVRQLAQEFALDLRWEAGVFDLLQEFAELEMWDLLSCARNCMIHADRTTLFPEDVHLVLKNLSCSSPSIPMAELQASIKKIRKPLKRSAKRSKRVG